MSEIKALDSLRETLKGCVRKAGIEPDEFDTYWITASACDACIDEIEREISERYMLLPVDMDNEPICMGDSVEGELLDDSTVSGTVCAFHLYDDEPDSVYIKVSVQGGWTIKELRLTSCRHVKLDPLKELLTEMLDRNSDGIGYSEFGGDFEAFVKSYAERIRELMGGDAS